MLVILPFSYVTDKENWPFGVSRTLSFIATIITLLYCLRSVVPIFVKSVYNFTKIVIQFLYSFFTF